MEKIQEDNQVYNEEIQAKLEKLDVSKERQLTNLLQGVANLEDWQNVMKSETN